MVTPLGEARLVAQTLGMRATEAIRKLIVSGDLKAGSRLSEVELSKALGVSRGPIREALRDLANEGLVETVPHRGTVVRRFDVEEVRAFYEARQGLEGYAARLAASRASEEDVEALETLLKTPPDDDAGHGLRPDFHRLLLSAAGSPELELLAEQVNNRLLLARVRSGNVPARAELAHKEHKGIVEAIRRGDGALAEDLMRTHLENSFANAKSVMTEKP